MVKLEQHCWRHLMSIVDNTNCSILHDLADRLVTIFSNPFQISYVFPYDKRYDCPALKLTAWRVVQETTPGFGFMPSRILNNMMTTLVSPGSGVTGIFFERVVFLS